MINLLVDEAFAFDYYSILEVKQNLFFLTITNQTNLLNCRSNLREQIGDKLFFQILDSKEYNDLYLANLHLFKFIDNYRQGQEADYNKADSLNLRRFQCKQALQNKFFQTPLTETKVIYEK